MCRTFETMLRRLRLAEGWSQLQVSERLHIDRSTYSYYESGKSRPGYETLVRIAKLYGVSVDFLLEAAPPSTSVEKAFMNHFISLPEEEQTRLLRLLEDLADIKEKT